MFKKILIIINLLVCSCSSFDSNPVEPPSIPDTGNHPINSLWFVPNSDGTWGIGYNSNVQIGGFQITINGSTIISIINGAAQENGFSVTPNETSGLILGFSLSGATIPVGSGILLSLELDGTPTSISDILISDESANSVEFTFEASFFSIDLETTGEHQLTIFSSSITSLQVGDEIGIFDANGLTNYNDCSDQHGELVVGSAVWTGEQLSPVSIGSVDMCSFGGVQLAGYVEGNLLLIKVYRPSTGVEYSAELIWGTGTGTFGEIIQSVSEIELNL